ncbi:purine permease [Burkholderia pseudomallei]|nr:purine permease [Burkholderia pseudomallei]MBF3538478.1 purine permease [Burkholderia pseudomallei]MBF3600757.1 purine permease [Burkholderia pseudomallei]
MPTNRYLPAASRSPADHLLPFGRLALLGFQHVLVMYAAAIAVPLIIGGALNLPKDQIAHLISADLFVSGLVTMVQTIGIPFFGVRLPIMMGVSFTGIGTMIAIASKAQLGLPGVFGSMLAAGAIIILLAPLIARILRFFPTVVVGTILLTIGVSLMQVSVLWAAGGFGVKDFGNPVYIAIAFAVMLFIILVAKYSRGFINNVSVLFGIGFGIATSMLLGKVDFSGVSEAPWLDLVLPFRFGAFRFDLWSIVSMTVVMMVNVIETAGVFVAVSRMADKPVSQDDLVRGFRADGLGSVLGAVFNIFPYTSYSENVGLLEVTGVRSRWVCATGGAILVLLALVPKLSAVVASVPVFVLGGVGMIMFGMIGVTGIKMLSRVDFVQQPLNGFTVAISIGVGLTPVFAQHFFDRFPAELVPLLQSGIVLAAICAVGLNVLFNGFGDPRDALTDDPPSSETALVNK